MSKFKIENIERGSGIFAGSAGIFNWTGISFELSKKILNLCKERVNEDDILSKFYYRSNSINTQIFSWRLAVDWSIR